MAHIVIRHKVQDYLAWKSAFDNFHETRKTNGEKSYQIYHPEDNPDNLIILFKWDTMDNAKTFMQSEDLKSAMKEAGVLEPPEVYFTNMGEHGTT
jgi:quinol monooxygenase YgiN